MRLENQRMKEFLLANGLDVQVKYIMKWAIFKNKIFCSRLFLAWHVLRGRPLAYKLKLGNCTLIVESDTRLVGNTFNATNVQAVSMFKSQEFPIGKI